MSIQSIFMGEDSNRLHSQFMGGSEDSDSNFTSVGDEDLLEWTTGVVGYCSSDTSYCSSWMRSLESRASTHSTSRCTWETVAVIVGHDKRHSID
jgi:biotin synthase-related radical SAM superfamily protein